MRYLRMISLCLLAGCASIAAADDQMGSRSAATDPADWAAPNWETGVALVRAKSSAARALAVELRQLQQDDPAALLQRLQSLVEDSALDWPEKEAALLQFTQSLHELRADQVSAAVIDLLAHWQPRTLVAHEEAPALGTPLFDIAATAQGLQNRRRREAATDFAAQRLREGADRFLQGWLDAVDPMLRAGWLDAVQVASLAQRKALLELSLSRLQREPQLAPLAAQAAIGLRDAGAMTQLAFEVDPVSLRPLLAALASELDGPQLEAVLAQLVARAPTDRAALAIAAFSDALAGRPEFEQQMLALLAEPGLGSSAALALGQRPSAAAQAELESLAAGATTSLHSQRARLALDRIAQFPAERTP